MFKSITLNKERKTILIIGAVLLLLGAIYRVYPSVQALFSDSDEIEIKKKTIEKYQGIVAGQKGVERLNAQAVKLMGRVEAGLLTGKTSALAAVEVQGIINDIAAAENVKIQTMQVLAAKESKEADTLGYELVPVKITIKSNILQLKEMIYKIESSDKLLVITDLSLDAGARGDSSELRSTLTVEGVMKTAPKEAPAAKKTK
jgi:hypothetical protein